MRYVFSLVLFIVILLICYIEYIRTNEIISFLPMLIAVAFIVIDAIEIIKERKANNKWNKKVGE